MTYQYERHQNGYYIHKYSISGLVLREEMEFTEEQEEDFIYQVARWVKGKGYEVLYYTGSKAEANQVYRVTLALESLKGYATWHKTQ